MTDLMLPAAAPVETYIDEIVTVLGELLEDTPADVLAGFDFKAQGEWAATRRLAPKPIDRRVSATPYPG